MCIRDSVLPAGPQGGSGATGGDPAGHGVSPVLAAEGVGRVLSGEVPVTLVQDVTVAVERGEFAVIMGPSGSGKSSLLYLLGLLDTPTSGRVLLEGQDTSCLLYTSRCV